MRNSSVNHISDAEESRCGDALGRLQQKMDPSQCTSSRLVSSLPDSRSDTEENTPFVWWLVFCSFVLYVSWSEGKDQESSFFLHAGLRKDLRFSNQCHSVLFTWALVPCSRKTSFHTHKWASSLVLCDYVFLDLVIQNTQTSWHKAHKGDPGTHVLTEHPFDSCGISDQIRNLPVWGPRSTQHSHGGRQHGVSLSFFLHAHSTSHFTLQVSPSHFPPEEPAHMPPAVWISKKTHLHIIKIHFTCMDLFAVQKHVNIF